MAALRRLLPNGSTTNAYRPPPATAAIGGTVYPPAPVLTPGGPYVPGIPRGRRARHARPVRRLLGLCRDAALEQRTNLGLLVPPMPTEGADRRELACLRP